MALSPENEAFISNIGLSKETISMLSHRWFSDDVETLIAIAKARGESQGRASLEERVRLLEEGLRKITLVPFGNKDPAGDGATFIVSNMAWKDMLDIARALLATLGERENGS